MKNIPLDKKSVVTIWIMYQMLILGFFIAEK